MEFNKLAIDVLEKVGGKENVKSVTHCMTRLRFVLHDVDKANKEVLKNTEKVAGVVYKGGQLQLIIGGDVSFLYEEIAKLIGNVAGGSIDAVENDDEAFSKKPKEKFTVKRLVNNIFGTLASCLTPVLPVIIFAGLIKMITAMLGPDLFGIISAESDLYVLLTFVGDAGFYFLPIFIGISASKVFRCNILIAVLMGCVLLHPTLASIVEGGQSFTVYGIPMVAASFGSTVIPMILITWVMSYVERIFKKYIPKSVAMMFVPLLTVLVMLPLALCVLGPIGTVLGEYICEALVWIRNSFGPFGVALIAASWIPLIATGMHVSITTPILVAYATYGYDAIITPGLLIPGYVVMGIALAFSIKAKNASDRELGISSFVSQAIGGVTEPAIFGILLLHRKTLIISIIGSFIGGLYVGFTNCVSYFMVESNFLAAIAFFGNGDIAGLVNGIIGCVLGFLFGLIAILVVGYEETGEMVKS